MMKKFLLFCTLFLILNSAQLMAEDSKEEIKEIIAIINELESSAQKAQAEAERVVLEKRKQEELARIEIETAKSRARQALMEQKNKEVAERVKLKEAADKLALEKRKQEELVGVEIEAAKSRARQALMEQKNKEATERVKLKEAADKQAMKREF